MARREHWLGVKNDLERALAWPRELKQYEKGLGGSGTYVRARDLQPRKARTVAIKPDTARYSLDITEMLVNALVLDTEVRAQNNTYSLGAGQRRDKSLIQP